MNLKLEPQSKIISTYKDSAGTTWTQLRLNEPYSIDISQYSPPYADVDLSQSPDGMLNVDESIGRSQSKLILKGQKLGKCKLTVIPVELGEGPERYPSTTEKQEFNIEIVQ